jgi:hypothetical protein
MSIYDRSVLTAQRLLVKYGHKVTWRSMGNGALIDPTKPWLGKVVDSTKKDYAVSIAFLNVPHVGNEDQHLMNQGKVPNSSRVSVNSFSEFGFSVQSVGNTLAYMAQVPFEPAINDIVIRYNREHRIVNLNNVDPGGIAVLYIIELEM